MIPIVRLQSTCWLYTLWYIGINMICVTGKNNGFPFWIFLGIKEYPIKMPNLAKWHNSQPGNSQKIPWLGLVYFAKFGIFIGYSLNTQKYPKWESVIFSCARMHACIVVSGILINQPVSVIRYFVRAFCSVFFCIRSIYLKFPSSRVRIVSSVNTELWLQMSWGIS